MSARDNIHVHYADSKEYANQIGPLLDKREKADGERIIKSINLDSIIAQKTMAYELTGKSKTSMKEVIKGNDEVVKAKLELMIKESEIDNIDARIDLLGKQHYLEKAMIDACIQEMRLI